FEEFHNGDFEEAPANINEDDSLHQRLLDVWLQLLAELNIPVVVVFDQLEDYLRAANDEREKENRRYFTQALASFVQAVQSVCVLVFAEQGFWNEVVGRAEKYITDRLTQPFSLPGRSSRPHIEMPDKVDPDVLKELIRKRVHSAFPDLNLTGLPPAFPFDDTDLQKLQGKTTIRECLRALAKGYDAKVHAPTKQ